MVERLCCSGFAGCKPWWGSPHISAHHHRRHPPRLQHPPLLPPSAPIPLPQPSLHLCIPPSTPRSYSLVPSAFPLCHSIVTLSLHLDSISLLPLRTPPSSLLFIVSTLFSLLRSYVILLLHFFSPFATLFSPLPQVIILCPQHFSPAQHSNPALPLTRRCMGLLVTALATARYNCNNSG